jgi:hypothetical protein
MPAAYAGQHGGDMAIPDLERLTELAVAPGDARQAPLEGGDRKLRPAAFDLRGEVEADRFRVGRASQEVLGGAARRRSVASRRNRRVGCSRLAPRGRRILRSRRGWRAGRSSARRAARSFPPGREVARQRWTAPRRGLGPPRRGRCEASLGARGRVRGRWDCKRLAQAVGRPGQGRGLAPTGSGRGVFRRLGERDGRLWSGLRAGQRALRARFCYVWHWV